MATTIRQVLEKGSITASAPCRIDMGGTLDLPTFFFPLRHLEPMTVNLALALRTRITLSPYRSGWVKVSSKGFKSFAYRLDAAPFDIPVGLIFAVAAYFRAAGVQIEIVSESPPQSGLGGSSVASVALVAALQAALQKTGTDLQMTKTAIATTAQAIEASVAGVPCGYQDQLAAAYGGVNAWRWSAGHKGTPFKRQMLARAKQVSALQKRLLVAYCGVRHESKQVNRRWVAQYTAGTYRREWSQIISYTHRFAEAIRCADFRSAAQVINKEVEIRRRMTPEVLDEIGAALVDKATECGCGARFTGAGAGGCLWAIGEKQNISRLKPHWQRILKTRPSAGLLSNVIDRKGVFVH